jgi:opacity protein-like surface antigen
MKHLFKTLLISLSLLITNSAIAEDNQSTRFYGGIGLSSMAFDYFSGNPVVPGRYPSQYGTSFQYRSINPIALIGYKFNEYISLETEWSHLLKRTAVRAVNGNSYRPYRFGVSHRGHFVRFEPPKSGSITPYGRLGFLTWKVEEYSPNFWGSRVMWETNTDLAYGLGINYKWNDNSSIRIEYTTLEASTRDFNYDVISVMREFSF